MRRPVVFLSVVLLALATAGCAGDSSGGSVRAQNALARTKAAKTAAYSIRLTVSTLGEKTSTSAATSSAVELSIDGLWDLERNLVLSKVKYKTPEAEDSADYRVLGKIVYAKGFTAEQSKWKMYDEHDGGVGSDTLGNVRPDPALEILAGLTGKPKKVGEERIGGVKTTHFRATADLKRAVARSEDDAKDALQARLDNTEGDADVDMWLDGEGRVRRLITFTTGKGGQVGYRTTFDFKKFGVPVNVSAPPAAEIATDVS